MKYKKLIAATVSCILAAGMMMPVYAYRTQLGDYQRIGSNLYLSENGAIAIEGEDQSGVLVGIRTKKENKSQLQEAVQTAFRAYFTGSQYKLGTYVYFSEDTQFLGTEDEPVYYFTIVDSKQGDACYSAAAQLYEMLSLDAENPMNFANLIGLEREIVEYKYYPCCGSVNWAGIIGYASAEGDETAQNITNWLNENAPEYILAPSKIENDALALKLRDSTENDSAGNTATAPLDLYIAIYDEFGYIPMYYSTDLATFGNDVFAVDFLKQRAEYDAVTDEEIQAAIEKYRIPEKNGTLYIALPNDSIKELANHIGCSYNDDIPSAGMISEELAIGFAANIANYSDICGFEGMKNGNIFIDENGYGVEVRPPEGKEYLSQEDFARILVYLKRHVSVQYGVHFEEPVLGDPENKLVISGDLNSDGEVTLSDAVVLAKCAAGRDVSLVATGRIAGDINGNGMFDADDLAQLLRSLAGL